MTAVTTESPKAAKGPKLAPLVVGTPRVSLLPPEIGQRNKALGVQRGLRLLMFFVLALTVAAIAGAWYLSFSAQLALQAERDRTAQLQAEQLKYADVQNAVNAVALGEAGLTVGSSTAIDWQDYLTRVQASLPEGVWLDSFTVDAASATAQYPQSSIPLEGARIASLQFSASSPALPQVEDWLKRLATLPGFVNAYPGSVVLKTGEAATYSASVTMYIDAQAYINAPELEEPVAGDATAGTEEEAGE